jgi:hypothetical protein
MVAFSKVKHRRTWWPSHLRPCTEPSLSNWPRIVSPMSDQDRIDVRKRLSHSVAFARDGLRGLLIINGGAVVGLFTFLGSIAGKGDALAFSFGRLWVAFGLFAGGTGLAVAATVLAYLSQDWFYMFQDRLLWNGSRPDDVDPANTRTPLKSGEAARALGIVAAVLSLLAFGVGSATALSAFLGARTTTAPACPSIPSPSMPPPVQGSAQGHRQKAAEGAGDATPKAAPSTSSTSVTQSVTPKRPGRQ